MSSRSVAIGCLTAAAVLWVGATAEAVRDSTPRLSAAEIARARMREIYEAKAARWKDKTITVDLPLETQIRAGKSPRLTDRAGLVELYIRQDKIREALPEGAGRLRKLRRTLAKKWERNLDPYAKQMVVVEVIRRGKGQYDVEPLRFQSLAVHHRLGRVLRDKLRVPELMHGIATSEQTLAAVMAALGGATTDNPVVQGGFGVTAVGLVVSAAKRGTAGRNAAMEDTLALLKLRRESKKRIDWDEARLYYESRLPPGVQGIGVVEFWKHLRANGH